jgi:hypothetical protein
MLLLSSSQQPGFRPPSPEAVLLQMHLCWQRRVVLPATPRCHTSSPSVPQVAGQCTGPLPMGDYDGDGGVATSAKLHWPRKMVRSWLAKPSMSARSMHSVAADSRTHQQAMLACVAACRSFVDSKRPLSFQPAGAHAQRQLHLHGPQQQAGPPRGALCGLPLPLSLSLPLAVTITISVPVTVTVP